MKIITVCFSILFSISGCFASEETSERETKYQYYDVEYLKISWTDVLSYNGEYHVYVYSESCEACQSLKQDILNYAINKAKTTIYFVCYQTNNIPMNGNADLDKTIGATDVNDLYIGGTPTLIGVYKHSVTFNIVGVSAIREELEI